MTAARHPCPLCAPDAQRVLWRTAQLRVIGVEHAGLPGYCRVVWNAHVSEMTTLDRRERGALMDAVWGVETALRKSLHPDRVNLASLGNQVAHLHWHVVARFHDDPFFPDAIWAPARRPIVARTTDWGLLAQAIERALGRAP